MKRFAVALLLLAVLFTLSSCLPDEGIAEIEKPAGFLMGIWHGWVAPLSLMVGIFKGGVRIYEQNNTGWWYDFGFYIAIISGFGGLSLSRKKIKRNQGD